MLCENFSCCWCSASRETHFHLWPTTRVYELNLNWHIQNLFLTRTYIYDVLLIIKMRRIAVLVVVVSLFHRHTSDKFQEAISWRLTWRLFLHYRSLKYVVSDHFRWSNVPVNQNKPKMCLHFDQIRTWHRYLKHSFFGLYVHLCEIFENWSIWISNDWNHF